MVFCIKAELGFTTAARRDTVLAALTTRLAGRPRFGVDRLAAGTTRAGAPAIAAKLRYTTRLNQEDLVAIIEAQAVGVRTPVAGSWYALHDCTHDGSSTPCVEASRRVW